MIADSEGLRISVDHVFLILLFLFGVDVLDLSGMLMTGTILLFFFLNLTNIRFDFDTGLLLLFSLFYFGSVAFYEGLTFDIIIKFAIAPWGCYLIGYNMRLNNRSISVTSFATILVFGFFLHGMLNLYSSIQVFGTSLNNNYRLAYDFWQGRAIAVTGASLYYTPFTLMSIGILFFSKKKVTRAIAVLSLPLGIYASLIYQNRTLILACALIFALNLFLVLVDSDMPGGKKLRIYGAVAAVVLAAVIAFLANVAGIRDTIMNSSLMNRVTGDKQDRTTLWASFIFGEAWKYPFGGNRAVIHENRDFVHNTWLDVFRRGGLIPFLTLVTFTIRSFFSIRSFRKFSILTGEDCGVIISLLAGTALSFFVEPVIEANPYVFYIPILVMGAVNGHNRDTHDLLDTFEGNPVWWPQIYTGDAA